MHAPPLLYCKDAPSIDSMRLSCQMASAIPAQLCNSWLVSCNACRLTACRLQAARYQIMIMFLIAATTCIAVVGSVYLAVLNILDRQHRLCSEKILPRAAAGSGVEHWIQGQTVRVSVYTLQAKQHFKPAWGCGIQHQVWRQTIQIAHGKMAPRLHQECTRVHDSDSDSDSQLLHSQGQTAKCMPSACLHVLAALVQLCDHRLKCRTMLKVERTLTGNLADAGLQVCEQGGEACYRAHQSILWAKGKAVYSISGHWPSPPLQAQQEQPPPGMTSCLMPSQAMLSCGKHASLDGQTEQGKDLSCQV